MVDAFLVALAFGVAALVFLVLYLSEHESSRRLKETIATLTSQKQSLSTKYGKTSEQFMPFLSQYPYDPGQFRFLGSPIDGVQFTAEKIIFVEFKTHESQLTATQKSIQELVKKGKVEFLEFRIR